MASKVLVPAAPFTKLQVKKTSPDQSGGGGFIIGSGDAVARVAHLEHSVRFLQEQHRLMLSGLHAEIEALRERNRDLQFQLIFNKESSPKQSTTPVVEEIVESNEEANLKREVARLEREGAAARGEARAAEARALQLQRLIDAQAEKLRDLELKSGACRSTNSVEEDAEETRAELRARLADAERLVRRLRADAERQRRELQCMKNSLHASLRASGLESYGYQNTYHFPPVHAPEFWREPLREEFSVSGAAVGTRAVGGARRRPLTLPELAGQQLHRSTIYANNHTRSPRASGYDQKKKGQATNGETVTVVKTPEEPTVTAHHRLDPILDIPRIPSHSGPTATYPQLRIVVTKVIPHGNVSNAMPCESGSRTRPRRHHHRKHANDHT